MAHVSPSLVHSLHFEDISHHCTVKSLVCVVLGVDLREPGLEWYVVLNVIYFYQRTYSPTMIDGLCNRRTYSPTMAIQP